MALKDIWVDRIDGVDEMTAEDINLVAHSAIENEKEIIELKNKEIKITIDTEMSDESENPVQNKVIKSYVDGEIETVNNSIGETETALDMITSQQESIIAIQEELMGGDA